MTDWLTDQGGGPARTGSGLALDRRLARLLVVGMLVSVGLIGAGVIMMLVAGDVPLQQPGPGIDLARLPADVAALRPEGFLWLGLLVGLGTPFARVLTAFATYAAARDRRGALVTAAVLGVLLASLALALGTR